MENIWIGVLQQLVTTLSGVAFIGLSTLGGFYVKRLTDNLQRRSLEREVEKFVKTAEQAPVFANFSGEEKYEAVKARLERSARDHNIKLTEDEMMILIESAVKDMHLAQPLTIVRSKDSEEDYKEERNYEEGNAEIGKPLPLGTEKLTEEKDDIELEAKG